MSSAKPGDPSEGVLPRPAATLVLLRDTASAGPEVLATVRPEHLRFMGGATVFPGGALAEPDADPRWESASGRSRADAARAMGMNDAAEALALHICAMREAFEEVGYLAGRGPTDQMTRADAEDPVRFLERCLELGVVLATEELVPGGRWVTPLGSPIRFDTRFFLARAPAQWTPEPDPAEVASCRWTTPAAALAELAAGRALMAPPTVEMLQRLSAHASVADALGSLAAEGAGEGSDVIHARLSPLVQVVLAPNPGVMTGPGTNTYVVGSGPTCIVDPAVGSGPYLDVLLEVAGEVGWVLVTHRHPDHVGGVDAVAERTGARVGAFGAEPAGTTPVVPLEDGATIEAGGCRLVALHTPGHARDHLCFLLEGTASIFSGDNILGEGTAVIAPPDGDMRAYLASLDRLAALHIERIYPGHFRALDRGGRVIADYIAHRRDRERAILDAAATPSTLDEIVVRAYADTPSELHPIAAFSALAHLEMLREDGRAEFAEGRWSAV